MLHLWKPVPFSVVAVALMLLWVFVISPTGHTYFNAQMSGQMSWAAIFGTPAVIVVSMLVYLFKGNHTWREGLPLVGCLLVYIGVWVYALFTFARLMAEH